MSRGGAFVFVIVLCAAWITWLSVVTVSSPPPLDDSGYIIRDVSSPMSDLFPSTEVPISVGPSETPRVYSHVEVESLMRRILDKLSAKRRKISSKKRNSAWPGVWNSVMQINLALQVPNPPISSATHVEKDTLSNLSESRERDNSTKDDFRVLFLSKSAPQYRHRRNVIRNTWLYLAKAQSVCKCPRFTNNTCATAEVCVYHGLTWYNQFLVGLTVKSEPLESLADEVVAKRDFLLCPYEDHYKEITWKILWAMQWAAEHVQHSYLIFLDDDCFLQMPQLFVYLSSASRSQLYAGQMPYDRAIVQRSRRNKWFVDKRVYGGTYYPTYVWGACVIMTVDVVQLLVKAAQVWHPWLGVDDAFLGILAHASGVNVTHVHNIYTDELQYRGCNQMALSQQPIVVVAVDDKHLQELSIFAAKGMSLCPLIYRRLRLTTHYVVRKSILFFATVGVGACAVVLTFTCLVASKLTCPASLQKKILSLT